MSADPRIAKARAMRAAGATGREIAEVFGVAIPTTCRWTKPGAIERDRVKSREWKALNAERKRAADHAYAADPRNRGRCLTCRGPMGVNYAEDGECRSCAAARVRDRGLRIVEMWAQGESMLTIAAALGMSKQHLDVEMARLRSRGYTLPYRYRHANPRYQHLAA